MKNMTDKSEGRDSSMTGLEIARKIGDAIMREYRTDDLPASLEIYYECRVQRDLNNAREVALKDDGTINTLDRPTFLRVIKDAQDNMVPYKPEP